MKKLINLLCLSMIFEFSAFPENVEINFSEGINSQGVNNFYADLGVTSPNLRFYQGVPFPFIDDWGAVIDFGALSTLTGFVNFTSPVDFVELDVFLQAGAAGQIVLQILAFDQMNNLVSTAQNTLESDGNSGYLFSSIQVESPGLISRIEIERDRKIGIDTIRFGPKPTHDSNLEIPEPSNYLFGTLVILSIIVKKKKYSRNKPKATL